MYKILFLLLMFSSALFSQTWQNTMTLNTGLTIVEDDRIDLYTNQDVETIFLFTRKINSTIIYTPIMVYMSDIQ